VARTHEKKVSTLTALLSTQKGRGEGGEGRGEFQDEQKPWDRTRAVQAKVRKIGGKGAGKKNKGGAIKDKVTGKK